jgi:hypothetical protein
MEKPKLEDINSSKIKPMKKTEFKKNQKEVLMNL